jgi:hypothetical protein
MYLNLQPGAWQDVVGVLYDSRSVILRLTRLQEDLDLDEYIPPITFAWFERATAGFHINMNDVAPDDDRPYRNRKPY